MIVTMKKRTLGVIFSGILLLGVSFNVALHPHMNQWKQEKKVITLVRTTDKVVALTFDDGPDSIKTPAVLESLAKFNVQATFFIVGYRAEKEPQLMQLMAARSHEIANHSYSHNYGRFKKNDEAIFQEEIDKTNAIINQSTGQEPSLFRPPGGYLSDKMVDLVNSQNMVVAYWTWQQDSKDWRAGQGAETIANHIIANIQPGQIILLHDGAENGLETARAVEILLARLTADGYRFVTMSELIKIGKME